MGKRPNCELLSGSDTKIRLITEELVGVILVAQLISRLSGR